VIRCVGYQEDELSLNDEVGARPCVGAGDVIEDALDAGQFTVCLE
jgi:hypothetical protein